MGRGNEGKVRRGGWRLPRSGTRIRSALGGLVVMSLALGLATPARGNESAAAPVQAAGLGALAADESTRDFGLFNASAAGHDWANAYLLAYLSHVVYLEPLGATETNFLSRFSEHLAPLGLSNFRYFTDDDALIDTEVVTAETGDAIIITFRGTEPDELLDWATDVSFGITGDGIHKGFAAAAERVMGAVRAAILVAPGKKVWLTGHSLGGSLASVAAWYLETGRIGSGDTVFERVPVQGVYTYGGPRTFATFPFNYAFSRFDDMFASRPLQRWVDNNDIVPRYPPPILPISPVEWYAYAHVGQVNNILPNGTGGCEPHLDDEERLLGFSIPDHATKRYMVRIYTNLDNDLRLRLPEPFYQEPAEREFTCDEPLDVTPPVISPVVSGTLGDNGWYVSDVEVDFVVADGESEVSTSSCGPRVIDVDTAASAVTCTAQSLGGTAVETVTIKRDTTPPLVVPAGPYSGAEGTAVALNGSASSDATSGIASSGWHSANPLLFAQGVDPASFVPADDGAYPVTLTATDMAGNEATATTSVTVVNAAPVVDAGANRTAGEGEPFALAATFNDPGTRDTHTATIAWGDGTEAVTAAVAEAPFGPPGSTAGLDGTASATHVFADDGPHTVTVCVTDDEGGAHCDDTTVTVANVDPDIEIDDVGEVPAFFLPLMGVPIAGRFHDLGTLDTHAVTIDWGDGTTSSATTIEAPFGPPGSVQGAGGTFAASHSYAAAGTYTVTASVADDDGGGGIDTIEVEVLTAERALELGIGMLQEAAIDPGTSDAARTALAAAIADLDGAPPEAKSGALDKLREGDLAAAVLKIKYALADLASASNADPSLDLFITQLVLTQVAESVAADLLAQASSEAPNSKGAQKQIASITARFEQGRALRLAGEWVSAATAFHDVVKGCLSLLA